MERKRKYIVYHMVKGKKQKSQFGVLLEARQFAVECFRAGSFVKLENENGTLLTMK